jgi:hypothetical protein
MSLKHFAAVKIIVLIVLTLLFRPVPAFAQQTCVILLTGYGRGPFTLNVPSWVNRLEGTVTWSGLQLRVFLNGTVYATSMYDNPYFSSPHSAQGLGGTYELSFGGIMLNYVHNWEVRGCGNTPPTPTPFPTPTPTRTPIPWPTYSVLAPVCETSDPVPLSGVGTEYVAVGSSVKIYPDEGASGDPQTIYEVINPGMSYGTRYTGEITLPLIQSALIRVVGGSGLGLPFVWVEVTMCTFGIDLRPTPLTVQPDDIREVVAGASYAGTTCYTIMPSISVTIPIPFGDPINYAYDGFGVCLRKYNLSLRWGNWDAIAIASPIIAFAFLWAIFHIFRRG